MESRLWRHHLPLFILSFATVAPLFFTRPYPDIDQPREHCDGVPGLALLAATLLVDPWNLLRRRPNPVSSDLGRELGSLGWNSGRSA